MPEGHKTFFLLLISDDKRPILRALGEWEIVSTCPKASLEKQFSLHTSMTSTLFMSSYTIKLKIGPADKRQIHCDLFLLKENLGETVRTFSLLPCYKPPIKLYPLCFIKSPFLCFSLHLCQIILWKGNGCTNSKQRFRSGEKDKTEWSKKLLYMKKNIYLHTCIDLVLLPQRGSEKQPGKIASMAVYFKCLYVTLWKYKITSWNFFMFMTCYIQVQGLNIHEVLM